MFKGFIPTPSKIEKPLRDGSKSKALEKNISQLPCFLGGQVAQEGFRLQSQQALAPDSLS